MSTARVVAGILVAAALILAVLWWRARVAAPEFAGGPTVAAPRDGTPAVPAPVEDEGTRPPPITIAVPAEVPLASMVRSELAASFRGLRLPDGVADALADGRIDGALRALEAADDGDAAVALAKLPGFCAGAIGSSMLDATDLRRLVPADASPDAVAMVERTLQRQRDWGRRVVQGCEQAGLRRTGAPPAAQALAAERDARLARRLQRCADAGHAGCLAELARRDGTDPARRAALLQSAAILGSTEAQSLLLARLEAADTPRTPANLQAARYWREALAKGDPEYRAALLGCYGADCDPRTLDRAAVRAQLESAVRDGSITALSYLMTGERAAAEQVAAEGGTVDVTRVPVVNPSETDAYAWKSVAERLALQGCLGLWPTWASFVGATGAAERELRPSQLDEARRMADERWQTYGRAFAAKRGCSAA